MLPEKLPSEITSILEQMNEIGLRQRPTQVQMIEGVFETVRKQEILCVEAPTGTGKTLAYCLGALRARKPGQVIIVSTSTTTLQEQFFQKDLLLLEKILNRKLNVVLCKGRRRYVCHSRLYNPDFYLESEQYLDEVQQLQEMLEQGEWQGEIDKLPRKIDVDLWQKISTDKGGCSGGRCSYINDCIFYQNRRKMPQADIIVTNHSLLLSDLELGGGVILPEMKDSIYILDECHHLPEKALSHFAKQAAMLRSFDWINSIGKLLVKIIGQIKFEQHRNDQLNHYIKNLVESIIRAKQYMDQQSGRFIEKQLRITLLNEELYEIAIGITSNADCIFSILKPLAQTLDSAYEDFVKTDKEKADILVNLQATLDFVIDRNENLAATWRSILSLNDSTDKPPIACWIERVDGKEGVDYTLHSSPINISAVMKELFWNKCKNGVILCSATVRALGSFADFLRKLGLKDDLRLLEKALDTPFKHEHSVLYIPKMAAEPNQVQQEQHLNEMLSLLPQLILPKQGTLVLFTSRKAMDYVYRYISKDLKSDILLQDDYNKLELIRQHKEKIDKQERSIIFGLASFAEGVDLPGKYCQHVIIHKIPFTLLTDPISQTRSEWLKKKNGDPFQLVTLPEASIKLMQYIGRLLRHEDDCGIVTILDNRLYTKNYGKQMLANLPPFLQLVNYSIESFLQQPKVKEFFT